MDDLRFNAKARSHRIGLAIVSLLAALSLSLVSLPVMAVCKLGLSILVGLYMSVKGLVNGVIAVSWYSYKILEINWKD